MNDRGVSAVHVVGSDVIFIEFLSTPEWCELNEHIFVAKIPKTPMATTKRPTTKPTIAPTIAQSYAHSMDEDRTPPDPPAADDVPFADDEDDAWDDADEMTAEWDVDGIWPELASAALPSVFHVIIGWWGGRGG